MKLISIISFVLLLSSTATQAANQFRFYCYGEHSDFNGFLKLETHVEAFMTIKGTEATLHGHDFSYKLTDGNDVWSEANIESKDLVKNNPNYNPRTYKNHYQFDISKGINGDVKLLIPFNAGKTYDDHFNAVLIFKGIDDHAGDTVTVECSID